MKCTHLVRGEADVGVTVGEEDDRCLAVRRRLLRSPRSCVAVADYAAAAAVRSMSSTQKGKRGVCAREGEGGAGKALTTLFHKRDAIGLVGTKQNRLF